MEISCAILAGGKNGRMGGKHKAFLPVNGIPIIQRTINLLEEIFDEIIIVTNNPKGYEQYENDYYITNDKIKNIGPLGGIHSGILQTTKEAVFIVACDMPFLHKGAIINQIDYFRDFRENECDVLVPRIGEFIEPLHSIYRKNLLDKIYSFVENNDNYSIRSFLETINACYMDLEDNEFYKNIFKNLNTPEDLEEVNS